MNNQELNNLIKAGDVVIDVDDEDKNEYNT